MTPNTQTQIDDSPIARCPVCHGKGYLRCDCWPGDCICAYGDEDCDECRGTGVIDPTYEDDY